MNVDSDSVQSYTLLLQMDNGGMIDIQFGCISAVLIGQPQAG